MEPDSSQQSAAAPSVLQRKAEAGREEHRSRAVSLARALRLSVGRVADKEMDLAMAVLGCRREVVAGDALGTLLSNDHLILLLEGPCGQKAAALFEPVLAHGLVQQQTMGQVQPEAGAARRMTATDAALVTPFLDGVLSRAAAAIEVAEDQPILRGFRFGAQVPDLRLLLMALQQPKYHLLRLSLDVAGGQRQGELQLVLPFREPVEPAEGDALPQGVAGASTLEPVVMSLEADLRVALTRITCPVSQLNGLKTGAVLDLGSPAFDSVSVQTRCGARLGKGSLGQVDGIRAVQLHHRPVLQTHPRRRKGDVPPADLDAHPAAPVAEETAEPGRDDMPETPADMPELPQLAELEDFPELPEMRQDG